MKRLADAAKDATLKEIVSCNLEADRIAKEIPGEKYPRRQHDVTRWH